MLRTMTGTQHRVCLPLNETLWSDSTVCKAPPTHKSTDLSGSPDPEWKLDTCPCACSHSTPKERSEVESGWYPEPADCSISVVNSRPILSKREAKGYYPRLSSDGVCICTHNTNTRTFLKRLVLVVHTFDACTQEVKAAWSLSV